MDQSTITFHSELIQLAMEIGIILTVAFIVGWFAEKLVKYIDKKGKGKGWVKSLSAALHGPVKWLVWGYALFYVVDLLFTHFEIDIECYHLGQMRRVFVLMIVTWIAFRWKEDYEKYLKKKHASSPAEKRALVTAVNRLLTIVILIVSFLAFLDILNIPIAALLAFGGIGGLAIGLSAQGLISNFFGGLMIYINRHFSIGDWIRSPNKNFEGIVEEIGWYQTRIRTLDRRPTYVPNSLITDAIIENPGRMYNRRIRDSFSLTYPDINKVKPITKDIEEMLRVHPEVDQKQNLMVNFVEYAESSLEIEFYCFSKATQLVEYRRVQEDILLKIADIIAKHKAHFAFPTRTVHLDK